jgi:hypothetical protein
MFAHLEALQAIGTANGENRFTGTEGYEDSVTYVASVLEGAGYNVTIQAFDAIVYALDEVPEMSSPTQGAFEWDVDFFDFEFSASGSVTGPLAFVPAVGCEPADFDAFPAGSVALISRGVCNFRSRSRMRRKQVRWNELMGMVRLC